MAALYRLISGGLVTRIMCAADRLAEHKMTAMLGPNAIDLDVDGLRAMIKGQRTRLKAFLLDQSKIAGIGNAYIHDILFLAGLHPLRPLATLSDEEISRLQHAIHAGLQPSIDKGGAFYEVNLHGQKGGFLIGRYYHRLQGRPTLPGVRHDYPENQNRQHQQFHLPCLPENLIF